MERRKLLPSTWAGSLRAGSRETGVLPGLPGRCDASRRAVAIGLALLAGCSSPGPIAWQTTVRYETPGPATVLPAEGPGYYVPALFDVQVCRIEGGAQLIALHPEDEGPDLRQASQLASLIKPILDAEMPAASPCRLQILIVPVTERRHYLIQAMCRAGMELTFGVPSYGHRIDPADLSLLAGLIPHEWTEVALTWPETTGCLLRGSPDNRWVGEGLAEVVTARVYLEAARQHLADPKPVREDFYPDLLALWNSGERTLDLGAWLPGQGGWPYSDPHYLAAFYLASRWEAAAQAQGVVNPIAALMQWLAQLGHAARHEELMAWMSAQACFDLELASRTVALEEVIRFQIEYWEDRGFPVIPALHACIAPSEP